MKMKFAAAFLCGLLAAGLSACTNAEPEAPSVLQAYGHGDRNAAAFTLEELYAHSDMILRFTAGSVTHTVSPGTDRVMTVIQPRDVTAYKGSYQNEPLYTPGGVMPMTEYAELVGRNGLQGADTSAEWAEYHWENAPLIREGDDVIYFGEYSPDGDGTVSSTYFTQGTFLLHDGSISVTKEQIDEQLFDDFSARFGTSVSAEDFLAAVSAVNAL